jgi:hypothetical protein
MIKKFLLRGPIIVLICLAIGFAIVYGGGWLLQQLGCSRPRLLVLPGFEMTKASFLLAGPAL